MISRNYNTEQENFWAGEFGNQYISRNSGQEYLPHQVFLFSKILHRTVDIHNILEIGANIGLNGIALKTLLPHCHYTAIEINEQALQQLKNINPAKIYEGSVLDFTIEQIGQYDITFTSGVLIHIAPEKLPEVYDRLYHCSKRYILISEYYNPIPMEVNYRGHAGRLFKRDFAGEILDRYPDCKLIDYGFQYHKDPVFPADDLTWFLIQKENSA